jgi:hypothetical protein
MMTPELFVFFGGLFFGISLFVMTWKVMNTMRDITGVSSRSRDHERRDLIQYTERLWEKQEFSKEPNIAVIHGEERKARIRADAAVEEEAVRAGVLKPTLNAQSDLVNTESGQATFG